MYLDKIADILSKKDIKSKKDKVEINIIECVPQNNKKTKIKKKFRNKLNKFID